MAGAGGVGGSVVVAMWGTPCGMDIGLVNRDSADGHARNIGEGGGRLFAAQF